MVHLTHHRPPSPAVHLVPLDQRWVATFFLALLLVFLGSLRWLAFHANLPSLNSTWPDPGGETDSISPSGYGPSLFRTIPATIFPIANTGAMLRNGHKRAQDIAALAVELGCAQILVLNQHRNHAGLGETPRTAFRKGEALLWRSAPVLPTSGRIHCSVVTAASAASSMTATSTSTMEAASTVNASHSMRAGRTGASSFVESSPAMESRRH